MAGADEDEGGEEDVDDGIVWDEDEDPVGVGAQPDVILGDEQLQVEAAEPGEETVEMKMTGWIDDTGDTLSSGS